MATFTLLALFAFLIYIIGAEAKQQALHCLYHRPYTDCFDDVALHPVQPRCYGCEDELAPATVEDGHRFCTGTCHGIFNATAQIDGHVAMDGTFTAYPILHDSDGPAPATDGSTEHAIVGNGGEPYCMRCGLREAVLDAHPRPCAGELPF